MGAIATGWITLISVIVNAAAMIAAPFIARKVAQQKETLTKVSDTIESVAGGLRIIELAVEQNKDALSKTGAGDRVVQTIRTYGPAAKHAVDEARALAAKLGDAVAPEYTPPIAEVEKTE